MAWNVVSAAAGVPGPQGEQGEPGPEGPVGPIGFKYGGRVETEADLAGVIDIADLYSVFIANDTGIGYQCVPVSQNPNGKGWAELGRLVGEDGAVGPQGETGATGPQGEAGIQGVQGEPGPAGAQGEAGPAGVDGVEGPEGPQGVPGLGLRFIARVATVGDLPATATQGDVYLIEATGDAHVWDETVPGFVNAGPIVGPTGAQGPAGPQGEAGPAGAAGAEGPQGIEGPTAVSADANNASKLGTDGKIFTPATNLTGYLPLAGGNMTGPINYEPSATAAAITWGPDLGIYGSTNAQGNLALTLLAGNSTLQVLSYPSFPSQNAISSNVPFELPEAAPTNPTHAANKKYVDDKVAAGGVAYTLPTASATVLGGVKIGTGMNVAADGTISTTASTNYVNKSGDVMNGPLRYANSGGVSSFNGQDVYTYYDGTYFRVQLPGSKSGYMIEIATGKVTFSIAPKCTFAPVEVSDLTNKAYVDSAVSSSTAFLKTTGGTMTGGITLPTTVQSLTWGASTYNIFGANGGVAVRYGNANIVTFTATGSTFIQKITTPGTGIGVEFGSSGGYLSKVGTGIGAYTGGGLRFTIDTSAISSTVPIAISVPATAANHAVTKSYVDALPTIVSIPAGGTAPDAALYPNNTLLVEYV
jgi:hypothetical protein